MDMGHVKLVGAGPGDPELLTIKAYKALCQADVVVYDRLVNNELLDLTPAHCKKIYAGKRKHLHTLSQSEINDALIEHAKAGQNVVRLKGGDGFIFGRGGEEAEALSAENITWEVIPGITAGVGAASSAGIPLTHREHAQALTFMTAHRRHGQFEIDWSLATRPNQTVVFYMATSVARDLVTGLIERGLAKTHHLSIVANATLPEESVQTFTLETFLDSSCVVSAPAVLILHEAPVIDQPDRIAHIVEHRTGTHGSHEHHQHSHFGMDPRRNSTRHLELRSPPV